MKRVTSVMAAGIILLLVLASAPAEAYIVTMSGGKEVKWPVNSVTYCVNTVGMPAGGLDAVKSALQTWTDVATADFSFIYGGGPAPQCGNTIGMGTLDSLYIALNTRVWDAGGSLSRSSIALNSNKSWATSGQGGSYDVESVTLHELGHTLSLEDLDCIQSNQSRVMYGCGNGVLQDLHYDDMEGITHLYPMSGCIADYSPGGAAFSAYAGQGWLHLLTSSPGCSWSAIPSQGWISINGSRFGTGSADMGFMVSENPDRIPRSGTIDFSGNGISAHFPVTQAGGGMVTNGDFEAASGWDDPHLFIVNDQSGSHTGTHAVWFHNPSGVRNISQQVYVPSNAMSASLSFWYRIDTTNTSYKDNSLAFELRYPNAYPADATVTTITTLSNMNKTNGWVQSPTFVLYPEIFSHRKQKVDFRLSYSGAAASATSFYLDDISFLVNSFMDVPQGHWAENQIWELLRNNVTSGCLADNTATAANEAKFCPDGTVTRSQMAVFILKALGMSPSAVCSGKVFTDVNANMTGGDAFCRYVEKFKELNITAGCTPSSFCPENPVTRGQMAVFLMKALNQQPAGSCAGNIFGDVSAAKTGDTFCRYIERFSTLGITSGCGSGNYCPNDNVTRAQMAVFLTKGFLQ